MNILDKQLYFPSRLAFCCLGVRLFLLTKTIEGERLSQDINERFISRQKNAVQVFGLVAALCCDVQSNQSLSCTRNTRYEAHRFERRSPCLFDNLRECRGGCREINCCRVTSRNLTDRMLVVKRHRCFNDRWRW